jgi:5-methylcytosine-specific restriction endonuclease McrA
LHCGRRGGVTVDHVIPVAVGGENRIANLQPLCEECNCEKDMDTTDYRDPYLHAMFLSALCEEGIL